MQSERFFRIAMIRETFPSARRGELPRLLVAARHAGADLAVLPELPLLPWIPASKTSRDEDAEYPNGASFQTLSAAARTAGIAVVGGAITLDSRGRRFNTALVLGREGDLVGRYSKVHLPEEEGFWETSHYRASTNFPTVFNIDGLTFGIQICSDINRPTGAFVLGYCGAAVILVPRATEAATFDRWRLAFRAVAMQSASYVLSPPRPRPEEGVGLGGPTIAVGPGGEVLVESEETLVTVDVDLDQVALWRKRYPGYLNLPDRDYARWWMSAANERQEDRWDA